MKTALTTLGISLFVLAGCTGQKQSANDFIQENIDNAVAQETLQTDIIEKSGEILNPRTIDEEGNIHYIPIDDWCSGFFPGNIWYTYELTGDKKWLPLAEKYTEALDSVQYLTWHHDVGFMIGSSYLNGYRFANKEEYKPVIIQTARSLSTRFRPNPGVLDRQTQGNYYLEGQDVNGMSDEVRSAIRNRRIGFVFQNFNLLPRANALKNVMVPLLYGEEHSKNGKEHAMEMLKMVGMEDRADHRPNELSGGQKQRVAIARAMINDPAIILADEPTGALDSKTGHMVMDLFHKLHEEQGKTIVLITHSQELAQETERIVTLLDGQIVADNGGEH